MWLFVEFKSLQHLRVTGIRGMQCMTDSPYFGSNSPKSFPCLRAGNDLRVLPRTVENSLLQTGRAGADAVPAPGENRAALLVMRKISGLAFLVTVACHGASATDQ